MQPQDPTLAPGQEFDGYQLIRFLGRGGFGEVWLCRSGATGSYHAIKFISGRDTGLLEKEHHSLTLYRRAASQLRSPHLVPIEHINRHEAGLYYVMPLADGSSDLDPADPAWEPLSLATVIGARAAAPAWFTGREIISLMTPLLEGLQTLSDAGLVHRDVKPDNILFFNGSPCLGDISLLGEDAAVVTRRGTPGYATPSWYRDGLPDMYGAAATLYTLLTGNSPDKMGRAAFLWPPRGEQSLPESERAEWKRLHAVIRRATEEEVGERYVNFRTMTAAVATGVVPVLPPAPPVPVPSSLHPKGKSKLPQVVAALLVITVGAVILANWIGSHQNPLPPNHVVSTPTLTPTPTPPATPTPTPTLAPAPAPASRRAPKIVDMRGQFKSIRERVLAALPGAIAVPPNGTVRLDLGEHGNIRAIFSAYESRDYEKCLGLLDKRMASHPGLERSQSFLLTRALVLQRLERMKEVESLMSRVDTSPESGSMEDLKIQATLMEALEWFSQGEQLLSSVMAAVPASTPTRDLVTLYNLRARFHILRGNHAEALSDERAALQLPPNDDYPPSLSKDEVQQLHLNTIVMEWELLEQEFPAYADYLEANGWPEPKPDHRNLRALD